MSYEHISIEDRACLYTLLNKKLGIRAIARALQRSPSTILREIKRNSRNVGNGEGYLKYYPKYAEKQYRIRRKKCHRYPEYDNDDVKSYIEEKIKLHWSPEQIFNREQNEIEKLPSISTIYRMIHNGKIGKQERIRMCHLRRKGEFKGHKYRRGRFDDKGRSIRSRPNQIYKRDEIGHWEGDTIDSGKDGGNVRSKYCLVSLVERKTRFCIVLLSKDKVAKNITKIIIEAMKDLPEGLVKTITFDRGKEFSDYEQIEKELGCKTYFCDPYCPWQKGTNENTNGLLREFYHKGMDLSKVDEEQLKNVCQLINNRPRKCINYKTPYEMFLDEFT